MLIRATPRVGISSAVYGLFCLCALTCRGDTARADASPLVLDLDKAVEIASARSPVERLTHWQVEKATHQVERARASGFLPRTDLSLIAGLIPGVDGRTWDAEKDGGDLGPYYQLRLTCVQPIYTFGKATAGLSAARGAVEMERAKGDAMFQFLTLEVIKAYWGLLAAERGAAVVREGTDAYAELLTEMEQRLEKENSLVDDSDLLEARTERFEIQSAQLEADEAKGLALALLKSLLNTESEMRVADVAAPRFAIGPEDVLRLVSAAESNRPDLKAMAAGVRALDSKAEFVARGRCPDVFLVAGVSHALAGHRDTLDNAWVTDEYNHTDFGAALGMKWDLGAFRQRAEARGARAEYSVAEAQHAAMLLKVRLEVRQAYEATRKCYGLLEAARESLRTARAWVHMAGDNWELGLGEVRPMIRAFEKYYRRRGTVIQAEYNYNVAAASLAHAIGDVRIYLGWVKGGQIALD